MAFLLFTVSLYPSVFTITTQSFRDSAFLLSSQIKEQFYSNTASSATLICNAVVIGFHTE